MHHFTRPCHLFCPQPKQPAPSCQQSNPIQRTPSRTKAKKPPSPWRPARLLRKLPPGGFRSVRFGVRLITGAGAMPAINHRAGQSSRFQSFTKQITNTRNITTLPHYQIITLSNYHIATLTHYHIITLPHLMRLSTNHLFFRRSFCRLTGIRATTRERNTAEKKDVYPGRHTPPGTGSPAKYRTRPSRTLNIKITFFLLTEAL